MIVIDAKNTWGATGTSDVLQRTDLWQVDFSGAVRGLNGVLGRNLPDWEPWHARSVTLPQKTMRVEAIRRDSRSYNMPSFDEPVEPAKVVFVFSSKREAENSPIYSLLDTWWHQARAGRGGVALDKDLNDYTPVLDANYRIQFRWNVAVTLLKGASAEHKDGRSLNSSSQFTFVQAWVSGFKVSDLSYESGNQLVTLEATLQMESMERV